MTPNPDDLDRMMAVMAASFAPEYGEGWNRAQLQAALGSGLVEAWLIDAAGRPATAGQAAGFALARRCGDEAELLLFAVVPACRRRGLGRGLLRRLCGELARAGAARLLLEVRRGNPAVRLYQAAGFSQIGERPAYYRGSGNQRFDALTFALPLDCIGE